MALLLEGERRTWKARVLLALVYAVLTLGAASMVYPFAVMLAASCASDYDYHRYSPAPRAFFDRADRFMRSIARHFTAFPREVYPDAPAAWTTWQTVAADCDGVADFARRELAPYEDGTDLAAARERARAFLERTAATDPRRLVCRHDARDVPGFLKRKYGTIDRLNAAWTVPHATFYDVSFSAESRLKYGREGVDKAKFADYLELKRDYAVRALANGDFVSRALPPPDAGNCDEIRNALAVQFVEHGTRDFLRAAFANYAAVGEYLLFRGRALWNTLVLVVLSLIASLTVNPLAAYALSRFRLRATESVILFLLATMAFPAAVTAIPGFLLLRDLGLLNTFAALVLPTVANGMSIFILKGFFDALPRELYEAAEIDGAGEWTVFRRITLPMTTPILAVNALNAFIHAYSSWEWAFLVCHRESHWTLAVWMYQLSADTFAGQPWCVMAGFVLVSIPTAAVFLLCQKVIMRGIVLPSMK